MAITGTPRSQYSQRQRKGIRNQNGMELESIIDTMDITQTLHSKGMERMCKVGQIDAVRIDTTQHRRPQGRRSRRVEGTVWTIHMIQNVAVWPDLISIKRFRSVFSVGCGTMHCNLHISKPQKSLRDLLHCLWLCECVLISAVPVLCCVNSYSIVLFNLSHSLHAF